MYHSIRRLARRDTIIFLTDNAVGLSEEENLAPSDRQPGRRRRSPARIVPFLTSKHSVEYCLMHASRAASHGFEALTVLGGDHTAGPPRCVPHARELRALIRRRVPRLDLGGWANPLALDRGAGGFSAGRAVRGRLLSDPDRVPPQRSGSGAVSSTEARRRGVPYPGVFGVFLYRSANPATLAQLADFFPVPAAELTREFDAGMSPEEICAKTVRTLREVGADKVYLSNLGFQQVEARYRKIVELL